MPDNSEAWTKEAVIQRLCQEAGLHGIASAQVFLHGGDPGENLAETAQKVVSDAASTVGEKSSPPAMGRVSALAKSFALTANPAVFEALARDPRVKSILPSAIADIYPKPKSESSD